VDKDKHIHTWTSGVRAQYTMVGGTVAARACGAEGG
jgi:hypothetical protein